MTLTAPAPLCDAGTVELIRVDPETVAAPEIPLYVTVVDPVMKPVPVIDTDVSPAIGPTAGEMLDNVGTGSYVNEPEALPPGVVTTIETIPGVCLAGVDRIICVVVSVVGVTLVPPTVTVVDPTTYPVPVIVTVSPPISLPEDGSKVVIVGTLS